MGHVPHGSMLARDTACFAGPSLLLRSAGLLCLPFTQLFVSARGSGEAVHGGGGRFL